MSFTGVKCWSSMRGEGWSGAYSHTAAQPLMGVAVMPTHRHSSSGSHLGLNSSMTHLHVAAAHGSRDWLVAPPRLPASCLGSA